MKKKMLVLALAVAILALGAVFLWPLSFQGVFPPDTELVVTHSLISIENGVPRHTTANYEFAPDSQQFAQIEQILSGYTYHRSLRSFSSDTTVNGNDAGYWLFLYCGKGRILCSGTGEIVVNDRVYRMGYWGNQKAFSLMEELSAVLAA